MKIFLPFEKDLNPYLEEISKYSAWEFVYGHFKNYDSSYRIVNIHWPEAIFQWSEPSASELNDLEIHIQEWKKKSVIVYTKHDVERHKGMTPRFKDLFKLIEMNTDVFLHLGQFSKNLYQLRYPKAEHHILYHPLYECFFKKYSKEEARERLSISPNSFVIIAPGSIRNFDERKLLLRAFKNLKIKDKVLIATTMRSEVQFDFRGRIRLKPFFDVRNFVVNRFKKRFEPPHYLFSYEKLDPENFSLRVAAADLIFIPRIKTLNSGNFFLGLSFKKLIVGPAIGNLKEQINELGMPSFNPRKITSVHQALKKGLDLIKHGYNLPYPVIEKYKPQMVANMMDGIFSRFVK